MNTTLNATVTVKSHSLPALCNMGQVKAQHGDTRVRTHLSAPLTSSISLPISLNLSSPGSTDLKAQKALWLWQGSKEIRLIRLQDPKRHIQKLDRTARQATRRQQSLDFDQRALAQARVQEQQSHSL